jgi:hypothetical protein
MTEIVQNDSQRRHRWPKEGEPGIVRLHGSEFKDGNHRTEKQCCLCGLIKITVHQAGGNRAWREWRTKHGQTYVGDLTPPCFGEQPK